MEPLNKVLCQSSDVAAVCLSYVLSHLVRYGTLKDLGNSIEGWLILLCNCLLMFLFRIILKKNLLFRFRTAENKKKNLLLIVNKENAVQVLDNAEKQLAEYKIIKCLVIPENKEKQSKKEDSEKFLYVNQFSEALPFIRQQVIDTAFISLPNQGKDELSDIINKLESMGIMIHLAVDSLGMPGKEKMVGNFSGYHVLTYTPTVFDDMQPFLKRCRDLIGAIAGIVLTILLGIRVVSAIYLESPGPVIF